MLRVLAKSGIIGIPKHISRWIRFSSFFLPFSLLSSLTPLPICIINLKASQAKMRKPIIVKDSSRQLIMQIYAHKNKIILCYQLSLFIELFVSSIYM